MLKPPEFLRPIVITLTCASFGFIPFKAPAASDNEPHYRDDGRLIAPTQYREWIFITSGLDMSYREHSSPTMSMFDNIFVNPDAYQVFLQTGEWPQGTQLVMETRGAQTKGSINQHGSFQNQELMGLEIHLRDRRVEGGWAFYAFDDLATPAEMIPLSRNCYSCHQQHGAVDTTFVQFYPTLIGPAQRNHRYHEPPSVATTPP